MSDESLISFDDDADAADETATATGEDVESVVTDDEDVAKTGDENDEFAEYRDENGLILGKYKSGKAAIQGYKELSKKMREKNPEPPATPEDYAFDFEDDDELKGSTLTMEDPIWKALAPVVHEQGIPQEKIAPVVKTYLKAMNQMTREATAAEKAKLGDKLPGIVSDVKAFSEKRNTPGFKTLALLAGTDAEAFQELQFLVKGIGEKPMPKKELVTSKPKESSAELWKKVEEYKTKHGEDLDVDEKKQNEYAALRRAAAEAEVAERQA